MKNLSGLNLWDRRVQISVGEQQYLLRNLPGLNWRDGRIPIAIGEQQ